GLDVLIAHHLAPDGETGYGLVGGFAPLRHCRRFYACETVISGMDRDDDIGLVRRFLALHGTRADELAPAVYRQPTADYTSVDHLERARASLFRATPLLAGLSAAIPDAADSLTLS